MCSVYFGARFVEELSYVHACGIINGAVQISAPVRNRVPSYVHKSEELIQSPPRLIFIAYLSRGLAGGRKVGGRPGRRAGGRLCTYTIN